MLYLFEIIIGILSILVLLGIGIIMGKGVIDGLKNGTVQDIIEKIFKRGK